ncbi:type II secretion system protein N [Dyella psychrodurans]|uniref:Type II secretion system protein N n=1 Tax=Dyella psychrodurans TaxID=1927960 RepID=A0A370XAK8_9GAMM|nr:type II secretion system protein N [Dyella psychrodurans]RDS85418.1 type II secretion system protein N [Dyella psychrodurans]
MKQLRIVLAGLAVLVLALAVLVWFMPAGLALFLLQSHLGGLRWKEVSGTIWQGRASQVSMPGIDLGSVAWTLSRRALIGDIRLGLDLRQPQFQLQGQMHRVSATLNEWRDVTVRADTALLGAQPWLHGQPKGMLEMHVAQAQLQGYWPLQMEASGVWSKAAVRTGQEQAPLGKMLIRVTGQAGVMQAMLDDDGHGPLQTAGRLSFSPLGWDLRVNLKPRRNDPVLLHWLHTLGPLAPDGTVQLRYRGGLNAFNSTTGNP